MPLQQSRVGLQVGWLIQQSHSNPCQHANPTCLVLNVRCTVLVLRTSTEEGSWVSRLTHHAAIGFPRLSTANAYIATNLEAAKSKGGRQVHLAKTAGPDVLGDSTMAGISAFAFQGTNAHVIVSR